MIKKGLGVTLSKYNDDDDGGGFKASQSSIRWDDKGNQWNSEKCSQEDGTKLNVVHHQN